MHEIKDYLSGIDNCGQRERVRKSWERSYRDKQGFHIIGRRGGIRDGVLEDETDERWLMMNTTR